MNKNYYVWNHPDVLILLVMTNNCFIKIIK